MLRSRSDLLDSSQDGDVLFPFRSRIWSLFGAVCVFVFLPGSIFVFATGYRLLSAGVILMLCTFGLNWYAVVRQKASGPATLVFVLALTFTVGLCVFERGIMGAFWTFPGVLLINFLTSGRMARVYTGIFFVVVAAVIAATIEAVISTRAIVALGVSILITNIFVEMIEKLQKTLVEQSRIDPLTGVLNRREMDAILREPIDRKRRSSTPASLLVIDVDRFKSVNDTHGHAAGDHVLREIAVLVSGRIRHMDKLFRVGGEEFVVMLPDTRADGAVIFADELRTLVFSAELISGRTITISIGVSELLAGESADDWLKRGDDAVYLAKREGRNRVAIGDDDPSMASALPPPGANAQQPVEMVH